MSNRYIITEQQFSQICEINNLITTLNESASFKDIVKKVKYAIAAGVAAATLMTAIDNLSVSMQEKDALKELVNEMQPEEENGVFAEKVDAVEKCMQYYIRLNGLNRNNTNLSPEKMVEVCEATGFDLPLMLAQAKVESVFGLTDRSLRTKSVFSVGSWDNGEDKVTYSDVNDSIEPYVNLMQKDYLPGKSISQLLQPHGFVNLRNQRYAKDPNYENTVRQTRNAIISRWPVLAQK